MINDNTILSSFNDRPTLLEWLKKVEEALNTDTATGVSVENPSVNNYIFKITFADGKTIASEPVKLPDSVKGVSISNNHLIITTQDGIREDLGVINPYADTIVLNSGTNTTEIKNNLQVNGSITAGGNELKAVVANPTEETTETLSKVKIGNTAYAVGDNFLVVDMNFSRVSGSYTYADCAINDEIKAKIVNGAIKVISGTFRHENGQMGQFAVFLYAINKRGPESVLSYSGVNYFDQGAAKIELGSIEFSSDATKLELSIKQIALP